MTDPPRRPIAITVVCWGVILSIVAAMLVGHDWHERATTDLAPTSAAADGPAPDLLLVGRAAVAIAHQPKTTDRLRQQLRQNVAAAARRPVDRLSLAVVVRELAGPDAAAHQLAADSAEVGTSSNPRLRADAAALARLYHDDRPPTPAEQADLNHDLGYFGRLAGTQATGADPAARRAVLAAADRTAVAFFAAAALAAAGFFVGFVGLVIVGALFGVGTLRPAYLPLPPPVARPVWLETFTVWLVAFVTLGSVVARLPVQLPTVAAELAAAALTAVVAFGWPAWRGGLSLGDVAWALGWHRGRGVAVEVLWGAAGYVLGLPVVAAGFALTGVLVKLSRGHPSHPLQREMVEGLTAAHVAGLLLAASVLAPLLEETVFRGALYAHLRRRHAAWVAAPAVAVLFAAVHPQGWTFIPVLAAIALVLAGLREWRGSLIAPVTAHAINNGVLVVFMAVAAG